MASWRRKQAPAQPPDALLERRKPRAPHNATTPFPANPAVRWRPANETAHEAFHGKHRRTPRKPAARLVQRHAAARGGAVGAGRQPHRRDDRNSGVEGTRAAVRVKRCGLRPLDKPMTRYSITSYHIR